MQITLIDQKTNSCWHDNLPQKEHWHLTHRSNSHLDISKNLFSSFFTVSLRYQVWNGATNKQTNEPPPKKNKKNTYFENCMHGLITIAKSQYALAPPTWYTISYRPFSSNSKGLSSISKPNFIQYLAQIQKALEIRFSKPKFILFVNNWPLFS